MHFLQESLSPSSAREWITLIYHNMSGIWAIFVSTHALLTWMITEIPFLNDFLSYMLHFMKIKTEILKRQNLTKWRS